MKNIIHKNTGQLFFDAKYYVSNFKNHSEHDSEVILSPKTVTNRQNGLHMDKQMDMPFHIFQSLDGGKYKSLHYTLHRKQISLTNFTDMSHVVFVIYITF